MVKKILKSMVLFGVVLFFQISLFAVPMYINYQGLLTQDGVVINGTRDIKFRIFDAESGGNNILGRDITHNNVNIVDGVFNTDIGPFSSGDLTKINTHSDLWLEVELDSRKFRQRLTSVSFAFRAESAKRADSAASVDDNSITSIKIKDGEVKAADLHPDALSAGNIKDILISENLKINSGKKLFFDGGNNAYISQSDDSKMSFMVNNYPRLLLADQAEFPCGIGPRYSYLGNGSVDVPLDSGQSYLVLASVYDGGNTCVSSFAWMIGVHHFGIVVIPLGAGGNAPASITATNPEGRTLRIRTSNAKHSASPTRVSVIKIL